MCPECYWLPQELGNWAPGRAGCRLIEWGGGLNRAEVSTQNARRPPPRPLSNASGDRQGTRALNPARQPLDEPTGSAPLPAGTSGGGICLRRADRGVPLTLLSRHPSECRQDGSRPKEAQGLAEADARTLVSLLFQKEFKPWVTSRPPERQLKASPRSPKPGRQAQHLAEGATYLLSFPRGISPLTVLQDDRAWSEIWPKDKTHFFCICKIFLSL